MTGHATSENREKPAIPSMLNTLTILTLIGSGVLGLLTMAMPALVSFFNRMMNNALQSGKEFSDKELADIEQGKQFFELLSENMVPLVAVGLIGCALCAMGAVMMRKLKKDGLWIYLAGQLVPLAVSFFLMGTNQFTGVSSVISNLILPAVFSILYYTQRKFLVH
jgi:hypothetical protein